MSLTIIYDLLPLEKSTNFVVNSYVQNKRPLLAGQVVPNTTNRCTFVYIVCNLHLSPHSAACGLS